MEKVAYERRTHRRYIMQVPVNVRVGDSEFSGVTRDTSAGGVFFYVDSPLRPDSDLEFALTLPEQLTLSDRITIACKGRVTRVEENSGRETGIAATIDSYTF